MAFFALLAVLMIAGSYAFVAFLAAACVYLPYRFQSLLLLAFGIVLALAMLWSLLPRRDKFTPPGPLLNRGAHPRLFAELDEIAAVLEETLPNEVYLIGDVNAWVSDRGGVMGFGSRRVMGLGLPLLSILTVSQLRAVLAHEFAHYYGGDTRLGPWVYKTQMSLIRAFQNVGSLRRFARIGSLALMFVVVTTLLNWYFRLFLLAMNLVSRKKEYRADELACLVAGTQPLIDGLCAIHAAAPAWVAYWKTEVAPVLGLGSIPAIGDGFSRFLSVPGIAKQVEEGLEKQIREARSSPYDSHPPLRKRIAAIQKLSGCPQHGDARAARTLLDNLEAAEQRLVETLNPKLPPGSLQPVTWDEVGTKVTVPAWKEFVGRHASLLEGIRAESLPEAVRKLPEMGSSIPDPKGMLLTREQRAQRAQGLLAMKLGLTLLDQGWELRAEPGEIYVKRGNDRLDPFLTLADLASGKLSAETWVSKCRELGISQLEHPTDHT
jgi:Zn-dependent protease with chaperone function